MPKSDNTDVPDTLTINARPTQRDFERALAASRDLLTTDPAAALRRAEQLVQRHQDPRVFRLAAAACRALGMERDAAGAELGAIQAGLDQPKLRESAREQAEGRSAEARRMADEVLAESPDDLLALTMSAEASASMWDLERAESGLRAVLERAPTFLRASMLLADTLMRQIKPRAAIAVLEPVLQRKPDNIPALTHMARLRTEVGDVDDAVAINERLVRLDGKAERWVNLAHLYRIAGRRDDAIAAFRSALAIDVHNGSAWWSLTNYFPDEVRAEDEERIRQALQQRSGSPEEGSLHLALGLLADRRADYPDALEHFVKGKEIRLHHQPYDPDPITAAIDSVIDLFTPEFYQERQQSGYPDDAPVFVIGMPRSGTTLVERILSQHSQIEGTGELQTVTRLAEIARQQVGPSEDYSRLLADLADEDLARFGKRYLDASGDYRRTAKPRFIDKNNLNWLQLGFILLTLPHARIIDVRRDAHDCCWANFKMLFAEAYPAANDLRHIGLFYRDYVRMTDALKTAAPSRIITVRYEDVVDDIEGQTRAMLDFLGLDFEPECIEFHRGSGPVATASSEQVRRPLNRKGLGSAAPYLQWLSPMTDALGPTATAGDD